MEAFDTAITDVAALRVTNLSVDTQPNSIMSNLMLDLVKSRDLRHRRSEMVSNKRPTPEFASEATCSVVQYAKGAVNEEESQSFFYDFGDLGVAYVGWYSTGQTSLVWHTDDATKADAFCERLHAGLEDYEPPMEPNEIRVQFWYMTSDGPTFRSRNLEAPTWDEIQGNYSADVSSTLDRLMSMTEWDPTPGKLILWRSPPGTGKTYALRALCRTWAEWATVSYICDPETMLQGNPGYLIEVVTREDADNWHLIVLEDSGELMMPAANAQQGQGLSRLLNTVDGLLGQGLKVVFLITTNEDIGKLHEALSRPGRCAMDLEFNTFKQFEAQAWLDARGYTGKQVSGEQTLAKLYGLLHATPVVHQGAKDRVVGFAGVSAANEVFDEHHPWNAEPVEGYEDDFYPPDEEA